jgi:phosphoadenosine phosphosulfate reductase
MKPDLDFPLSPEASDLLAQLKAPERIVWAIKQFPDQLVLSTSFGLQSAVMLDLVACVAPATPIIWVDTGYLFSETYQYAESLRGKLNLNLRIYQPSITAARQEAIYGKLWEEGTVEAIERYNLINKVEPMNRAIRDLNATAWLSGLRRSQASTRQTLPFLEKQNQTWKIYPILDWTDQDVERYMNLRDLPFHPLQDQGYASVGDWHSTARLEEGMSAEDTRFGGLKRECGLHEKNDRIDFQI